MSFDNNPELINLVKKYITDAGSGDRNVAGEAQKAIALALTQPLRQAVLPGDIVSDIFTKEMYDTNAQPEYQLDLLRPGSEGDFVAYTMPDHGKIPMRRVEGDRLTVPTYRIANSVDCLQKYLRHANWNVVGRMMEVLRAGFTKKINDDGFSTIISAGVGRNILVYDADASAGQFTPRLVSLAKTVMRRNGGGNSTSVNRGKLSRIYVSPEAVDDVRAWQLNLVADSVRAEIFNRPDGALSVFGVEIVDLDELGEGQQYNNYYRNTLGKSLATGGDLELAIGVDLSSRDSFLMPMTKDIEIHEDPTVLREGLFSLWADMEFGACVADNRRCLLLSL